MLPGSRKWCRNAQPSETEGSRALLSAERPGPTGAVRQWHAIIIVGRGRTQPIVYLYYGQLPPIQDNWGTVRS